MAVEKDCGRLPGVEGAHIPPNNVGIARGCSRSEPSILSAPAYHSRDQRHQLRLSGWFRRHGRIKRISKRHVCPNLTSWCDTVRLSGSLSDGTIVILVGSLEVLLVDTPPYRGLRLLSEVISHCVWLYHRVHLSLRDLGLLLERGHCQVVPPD